MMKRRICALALCLCLLLSTASALTVEQARDILDKHYIDEIPEEVLALPTIPEILDALGDPYTDYFTPEEYAAFMASMEDTRLVGIGIISHYLPEGILVNQVAPDSPAFEAGLKPGDYIVEVDGHDTRNAAAEDIESWIRGEEGARVTLTFETWTEEGTERTTATVTRRAVVFPTVTLDRIVDRTGWITCSTFGPATFQHFYDIITAYDDQVDGWVVDLRSNTGGDVYAAVLSASCFAGWRQGIYLRDGTGTYYSCLSDPIMLSLPGYFDGDASDFGENGYLTGSPVYVLTDGYTASASELFCAVIRDSGAGLVIGGRTFGKGVAQSLFSQDSSDKEMEGWFEEGDALKVTTERAYTTAGSTYDKVGILPHFLVDSDLADGVAALLAAPVSQEEDALILRNLASGSQLVRSMILPLDRLREPANAAAVEQLLSALPPTALCQLRLDGELTSVTAAQAAQACGLEVEPRTFSDLEGCVYAVEINTLGTYGIVSGVGDGLFQPWETLDRASLCALLVKAMRYPLSTGKSAFDDVPADSWYAPYVNALYELGIVNGYDDGLFRPNETVSHEQFLALLGRTAQWLDMNYYEISLRDGVYGDRMPDGTALAQEYPGYSDWARELIWLCDGGLAWDDLSQVDARAATTRQEAAAAMCSLLRGSGILSVRWGGEL